MCLRGCWQRSDLLRILKSYPIFLLGLSVRRPDTDSYLPSQSDGEGSLEPLSRADAAEFADALDDRFDAFAREATRGEYQREEFTL